MRTPRALLVAALATFGLSTNATAHRHHHLSVVNLPPPAQATIERETQGLPIRDVDLKQEHGLAVYEVEAGDKHHKIKLHVLPDGTLIEREDREHH